LTSELAAIFARLGTINVELTRGDSKVAIKRSLRYNQSSSLRTTRDAKNLLPPTVR
jgi:hypothetical protein